MALVKAAARLIVREHEHRQLRGPALCLGVPDIYLTKAELGSGPEELGPTSFVDIKAFLGALDIERFTSIDIPGSAHDPDLIHDLNEPLPEEMQGAFGLVVDPGTTEHVFDVRAGLTNIVNALAIGGTVIHFVPIYSYNGGYFSINPNVLHDFYAENGFQDLSAYVVMWDRYHPYAPRTRCYYYTSALHARHALADFDQYRFTPHLLLFATKAHAVGTCRSPLQNEGGSATEAGPSAAFAAVRRALPDRAARWLGPRVRRAQQLRRSRRDSFWV
jgi:hypothetical protein